MSHEIKSDLLPKLIIRYARRSREGKSRMLNELCEDQGYERKYAIKLLSDTLPKPTGCKHPGPERKYVSIEPIVRQIWLKCRTALRQAPGAHSASILDWTSYLGVAQLHVLARDTALAASCKGHDFFNPATELGNQHS